MPKNIFTIRWLWAFFWFLLILLLLRLIIIRNEVVKIEDNVKKNNNSVNKLLNWSYRLRSLRRTFCAISSTFFIINNLFVFVIRKESKRKRWKRSKKNLLAFEANLLIVHCALQCAYRHRFFFHLIAHWPLLLCATNKYMSRNELD